MARSRSATLARTGSSAMCMRSRLFRGSRGAALPRATACVRPHTVSATVVTVCAVVSCHRVLGMGGSREKKRRLKVLEDRVPDAPPGALHHKGNAKGPQGTRGLMLTGMRAVVCMDFVGDHCYVDIQSWCPVTKRTVELNPWDLHEGLRKWGPHWATGGGRMSHSAAARFKRDVSGLERACGHPDAGTSADARAERRCELDDIFGTDDDGPT
ncbi:hypothetical protein WJX74_003500 [Apatococcus lobatus]|uniref:Uncharacterized protein n=1 Tax=Apatococcus lobatus TaxID=904363 RepID=A0AAW1Q5F5_9CHLO